jgi:predicted porin
MQKKIIALAIAAMVSAPAFADNTNFTFYGTADVSNDFVNTGDGTTAAVTTANPTGTSAVSGTAKRVISSNVSKFGFKGAEDLGDGLHAIWQIEQQIDLDASANNTFASRNTFAGLKNESYGTVLMGRHDTPMKISTRRLDVFADNIADNRALIGKKANTSFDSRLTDVLAYISPAFSGVTLAVATANLSEANTTGSTAANSALSAAAMYDVAPFYVALAYESHTLSSASTATVLSPVESASRLGFGYKADGLELNAVYESTSDNLNFVSGAQTSLFAHTAYYVGGKYAIAAADTVKLAYGSAGQIGTPTVANAGIDTSATQISLGYDHGVSKRTTLYVVYSKIANAGGANYAFSQNSGAASTVSGYGASPTVLSLGLKHSF